MVTRREDAGGGIRARGMGQGASAFRRRRNSEAFDARGMGRPFAGIFAGWKIAGGGFDAEAPGRIADLDCASGRFDTASLDENDRGWYGIGTGVVSRRKQGLFSLQLSF